jgi:hypothetical protein
MVINISTNRERRREQLLECGTVTRISVSKYYGNILSVLLIIYCQ